MRTLIALAAFACLAACERPQEPGTSNNAPGSERGRDSMTASDASNTATPGPGNHNQPVEPTP